MTEKIPEPIAARKADTPAPTAKPGRVVIIQPAKRKEAKQVARGTGPVVIAEDQYEVRTPSPDSQEWQAAIDKVSRKLRGPRALTLMRVVLENAPPSAVIQFKSTGGGTMLNVARSGGGGMYDQIRNGEFACVQGGGGEANLEIGTFGHFCPVLHVPLTSGKITQFGDLVIKRPSPDQAGSLMIKLVRANQNAALLQQVRIGCITVGGPYGISLSMNADGIAGPLPVAPTDYWVLLPGNRRHKFNVLAKQNTTLNFTMEGPGDYSNPKITYNPLSIK